MGAYELFKRKRIAQEERYVLWGVPKGETDRYNEKILLSNHTLAQCERVKKIAEADGFHDFRISKIDNKPLSSSDFTGAINI